MRRQLDHGNAVVWTNDVSTKVQVPLGKLVVIHKFSPDILPRRGRNKSGAGQTNASSTSVCAAPGLRAVTNSSVEPIAPQYDGGMPRPKSTALGFGLGDVHTTGYPPPRPIMFVLQTPRAALRGCAACALPWADLLRPLRGENLCITTSSASGTHLSDHTTPSAAGFLWVAVKRTMQSQSGAV